MLSRTAMPWFLAPDYWLAREILERLLGAIYLFAFATVIHQFRPLLGENGLLPVPEFLQKIPFIGDNLAERWHEFAARTAASERDSMPHHRILQI